MTQLCSPLSLPPWPVLDSDNSLLRYLNDDKILVIQEEPDVSRECKRDTGRRSRKKSHNPSSPSYPISPSLLAPPVRLDSGPPEGLPFSLPESNTVPMYHVSHHSYCFYLSTCIKNDNMAINAVRHSGIVVWQCRFNIFVSQSSDVFVVKAFLRSHY